jgi:hypothetical protein
MGQKTRREEFPKRILVSEKDMRPAKQIVFRYNNDPATEEIDLDMDGEKSTPELGSFVERKGKRWKVIQVKIETNAAEPFEVPIHRIFLADEW